MSFRNFVYKDLDHKELDQRIIEHLKETELRLTPGLLEYIRILKTPLCPKDDAECAKYAADVLKKIKEDYDEGYLKQTLFRFIEKVLHEQKQVLKAFNNILKKI